MCSRDNEGNSIINKVYKGMTTNDSKFYLPYLSKLVDQYNNTYHHSINKNPYYC